MSATVRKIAILCTLAAVALALALGAAACSQAAVGAVTDNQGREVQLDGIPERIVSHVPSITETLFALGLGVYSRTLAPGLLFGDAGEFQFAAWRFGLAHPTGYPLYLLLGGSWQHLAALFGVDPATSLNAFSAFLAAATVEIGRAHV